MTKTSVAYYNKKYESLQIYNSTQMRHPLGLLWALEGRDDRTLHFKFWSLEEQVKHLLRGGIFSRCDFPLESGGTIPQNSCGPSVDQQEA